MYLIKSRWKVRGPNEGIPAVAFASWEWKGCTKTCQSWFFPRDWACWCENTAPLLPWLGPGILSDSRMQCCHVFFKNLAVCAYIKTLNMNSSCTIGCILFRLLETRKEMLYIKHMKNPDWPFCLCWPVVSLCGFGVAEPLTLQVTSLQSGKTNSKEELLCLAAFLLFQLY